MSETNYTPPSLAFADILVNDILSMSDDEVLAEAAEDGTSPEEALARVRAIIQAAEGRA